MDNILKTRKYAIMMVMAAQKKSKSRKSNVKNKQSMKNANRKMIIYFISLVFIFFAITRLGIFGVTVYNIVRLLTGSVAYLFLALVLVYMWATLFKKKLLAQNRRLVPGVFMMYLGLLLVIQGIFASAHGNDNALWYVLDDMVRFQVTKFAGSGFIGWFFYIPFKTLFSTVGVYIVGALLLLLGLYIAIPGLVGKTRIGVVTLIDKQGERRNARRKKKLGTKNLTTSADVEESMVPSLEGEQSFSEIEESEEKTYEEPQNFDNYRYEEKQSNYFGLMTDSGADWNDVYHPEDEMTSDKPDHSDPSFNFSDVSQKAAGIFEKEESYYKLPTSKLLTPIPPTDQSKEMRLVKKNSRVLEDTLRSFKISAKVISSIVGPSVTKYELKLATGVKVARILNLSDDLALALAAKDVRIEAPIPGKSLVGVEIPNSEVATVGFRDMWEHSKTNPERLLEVPLGKAFDGSIRTFDLTKMPHLLVAGATGSGKSVAVNGIITSILMKSLPSQVKFLMVDPKMVELSVYNDIPHLLIPVVTNPRKASRALQKVVDEMENRYELFSGFGVRNIESYNEKVGKLNNTSEVKYQLLPLVVVIVDELADLMMVASKEVEDAIIRLGQKARAAGIHMILATQRPSVDVISGLIKANVPSRIAFAVSSGTDSRTILDANGAEKLLGRGDMLFKPIDENHPIRLQGAFISDNDVESIVSFIKQQASADYDESFDPGEAEGDDSRSGVITTNEIGDPLFEQAKQLVMTSQRASTAQLQRALKVGFNRASDLMNELEIAGIVGPAKGTTPRKVLITTTGEILEGEE